MYFVRILIRDEDNKLVEIVDYAKSISDIIILVDKNHEHLELYQIYKGEELN